MSKRWDYQVINFKPDVWGKPRPEDMQAELKRLGTQGWELVSMVHGSAMLPVTAVFKREL